MTHDRYDYELNRIWLADPDNRHKYQGEFVVLNAGKLINHGRNFTELYRKYGCLLNTGNLIVRVYD